MAPTVEDPEAKCPKLEKETLLKKYNIPIQHLDFEYVKKCTDGSELEKILKILKSNEEGYFPALITATEERLTEIKPKSKLLRKPEQVLSKNSLPSETRHSVVKELEQWMKTMETYNEQLESTKLTSSQIASKIRQTKQMQDNENKKIERRIKSTDYESWAKYDADTEILKIELEEEKLKQNAAQQKNKNEIKLQNDIKHFATKAEAEIEATKEKQIGNEFYKANDYEEAIEHYTRSISAVPNTASYTNRALAYMKLKKYAEAINDCKQALKFDPDNLKAHLRLAECYEQTNKYEEAIQHVDCAIRIEPNNKVAQKIAGSLETYRVTNGKKIRFRIVEAQSGNYNKKQNKTDESKTVKKISKSEGVHNNKQIERQNSEIIAIPSTSKMSQPFFNVGHSEIPKKPLVINFVTIDNCSDDEDCTVNHLENRCTKQNSFKTATSNDSNNNVPFSHMTYTTSVKGPGSYGNNKKQEILLNDKGGGGEPCTNGINPETVKVEDLSSPYSFLTAWNSVKSDTTLLKKAEILENLEPAKIEKGNSFSTINKLNLAKKIFCYF